MREHNIYDDENFSVIGGCGFLLIPRNSTRTKLRPYIGGDSAFITCQRSHQTLANEKIDNRGEKHPIRGGMGKKSTLLRGKEYGWASYAG